MTHNNTVRGHSFQISGGVKQGLALADTGGRNADVNCVGGESFGCNLKRGPSSRGGLEEKVDDCTATEGGYFLNLATRDIAKVFSGIKQVSYLAGLEFPDA